MRRRRAPFRRLRRPLEGGDDLVGILFRVVKNQAADREIDDS
jgi:hypothetical protein